MEFVVVYFVFDNMFQAVSKVQVKSDDGDELKNGTKCKVPFKTQKIGDDGREEIDTLLYDGTIICVGQVKKKAVELALLCQKKLEEGLSMMEIINACNVEAKKRTTTAKYAEYAEEMKDEQCEKSKLTNKDSKKKMPSKEKAPKVKKVRNEKVASAPRAPVFHPEKLAEMEALTACILDEPVAEEIHAPPASVQVPAQNSSTPKKRNTSHLMQTPRRSPRLSRPQFEDISPVKVVPTFQPVQWDGTFTGSTDVLLDLDNQNNYETQSQMPMPMEILPTCHPDTFTVNEQHHNEFQPEPCSSYSSQAEPLLTEGSRNLQLCNLIGITPAEAQTASRVLRKLADALDAPVTNAASSYYDILMESNLVSGSDMSQSQESVVSAHSSSAHSSSPQAYRIPDDKQPLIIDPSNPEKFKDVLVSKSEERQARLLAKASKKPAFALLNGILLCVFTKNELAESSGLGLRARKEEEKNKSRGEPLDPTKVEAIREYIVCHCKKENWKFLTATEFNTTIINKITNVRRKKEKHPTLKCVHKTKPPKK